MLALLLLFCSPAFAQWTVRTIPAAPLLQGAPLALSAAPLEAPLALPTGPSALGVGSRLVDLEPLSPLHAAPEKKAEALPHFHIVVPNLFRSAQPTPKGLRKARRLGIRRVLHLREAVPAKESDEARAIGLKLVHVPMLGGTMPQMHEVDAALEVLGDLSIPTLVHCRHGMDRTGAVIAAWRVVVQGVDPALAAKEALSLGFRYEVDLEDWLRRYKRRRARAIK